MNYRRNKLDQTGWAYRDWGFRAEFEQHFMSTTRLRDCTAASASSARARCVARWGWCKKRLDTSGAATYIHGHPDTVWPSHSRRRYLLFSDDQSAGACSCGTTAVQDYYNLGCSTIFTESTSAQRLIRPVFSDSEDTQVRYHMTARRGSSRCPRPRVCPQPARAQRVVEPSGNTCIVYADEPDCSVGPAVWIGNNNPRKGHFVGGGCRSDGYLLWLSPREFLLLEGRRDDAPGQVNSTGGGNTSTTASVACGLKSRPPRASCRAVDDAECSSRGTSGRQTSNVPALKRARLGTLPFFFYYPEDRGVGGHSHDLEAMEVRVRMRHACRWTVNRGTAPRPQQLLTDECWPAAQLESVSGSAHGVGWYTNTLQVLSTRDTVLPLVALVEENKPATSPDRDGDGTYMPHYDVNRQSNDAWGIRDVAGTGKLGGSTQRRVCRTRRPNTRLCPRPSRA